MRKTTKKPRLATERARIALSSDVVLFYLPDPRDPSKRFFTAVQAPIDECDDPEYFRPYVDRGYLRVISFPIEERRTQIRHYVRCNWTRDDELDPINAFRRTIENDEWLKAEFHRAELHRIDSGVYTYVHARLALRVHLRVA